MAESASGYPDFYATCALYLDKYGLLFLGGSFFHGTIYPCLNVIKVQKTSQESYPYKFISQGYFNFGPNGKTQTLTFPEIPRHKVMGIIYDKNTDILYACTEYESDKLDMYDSPQEEFRYYYMINASSKFTDTINLSTWQFNHPSVVNSAHNGAINASADNAWYGGGPCNCISHYGVVVDGIIDKNLLIIARYGNRGGYSGSYNIHGCIVGQSSNLKTRSITEFSYGNSFPVSSCGNPVCIEVNSIPWFIIQDNYSIKPDDGIYKYKLAATRPEITLNATSKGYSCSTVKVTSELLYPKRNAIYALYQIYGKSQDAYFGALCLNADTSDINKYYDLVIYKFDGANFTETASLPIPKSTTVPNRYPAYAIFLLEDPSSSEKIHAFVIPADAKSVDKPGMYFVINRDGGVQTPTKLPINMSYGHKPTVVSDNPTASFIYDVPYSLTGITPITEDYTEYLYYGFALNRNDSYHPIIGYINLSGGSDPNDANLPFISAPTLIADDGKILDPVDIRDITNPGYASINQLDSKERAVSRTGERIDAITYKEPSANETILTSDINNQHSR